MSLVDKIGDDRIDTESAKKSTQTLISGVVKWLSRSEKASAADESDKLFIITAWIKDYSEYSDGTPVYPGGIRRVRVANLGNVVLDDEFNPSLHPEMPPELMQSNFLFNRFPYSWTQSTSDPASPFGFSDFEQLEKLNIEFNKTLTQFALFKDKTSRPKLVNPRNSGVTNDQLDNNSGIINPTDHLVAQAIQYMTPPPMQADIMSGLSLYKDLFNEVAGSFNDVMQGQRSGSEVIAAKAIAMLLEEASRMARGKIRNYSKMIRQRGRMFIALAQSWYDIPRYVQFVKDGKESTVPIDRNALQIAAKINVVNGSTMPVSNIQRREEVMTLAQAGIVDQEYVLEKFDIDNYKEIIQRMQQGPIGQYLQRLGMIGVPPEILQLFQQLSQMDEKQIQKAIESGQIPQFQQIIQQLMGQQQPPQPNPEMIKAQMEGQKLQIEQQKLQMEGQKMQAQEQREAQKSQIDSQKAQAEIQRIMAEAQKTMTEIELVKQQIETEVTERSIKMAGVEFDRENLTIERAKAVSSIRQAEKASVINKVKTSAGIYKQQSDEMRQDKGAYDERGMKSNNQTLGD
jgi:hypothetical protein